MQPLHFNSSVLARRPTSGLDVETTLSHFAIITYMVEPDALRVHTHDRFKLNCITARDGTQKALISAVPFFDQDFRFVSFPLLKWAFGQTNYRAYVTDSETGEHAAWFFGTSLDSLSVNIPRFVWKLPWYKARIHFDVDYDQQLGRYKAYRMVTKSTWAPANLEIEDLGTPPRNLIGFPDLETGLVLLTHPLRGFFYRRDGKLGSYSIWHDRLQTTEGRVAAASFRLLQELGLVHDGDVSGVHSVLIQHKTDFTIYLPPIIV